MRKIVVPVMSLLAVSAASLALGGMAFSQMPPLSEEDKAATPFPPGRHAALVKKVCVDCHGAKVITDQRFTKEDAENFYKNMVSKDLTTEQAQHIIEYLTTTLGV